MIEIDLSVLWQTVQIGNESTERGIAHVVDVVNVRSLSGNRPNEHLFQLRTIQTRTKPCGAHVVGSCGVIFEPIFHGKGFSKGFSVAGDEPIGIVLDRLARNIVFLVVLSRDEITQAVYNQIRRQAVKIADCRVFDPITLPVVVGAGRNDLIFLVHSVGIELLKALMLSEGNVWSLVKDEALRVFEGGRMTSVVGILVVHDRRYAFLVQAMSRSPSRHT